MFDRSKLNKYKDKAKEKAGESAQKARDKVEETGLKEKAEGSAQRARDKVEESGIKEKAGDTAHRAKDKAEDSALKARGKAKGLFEKPRTRTEETRFTKKTFFYCSTCDAEIGPMQENKAKAAMDKLYGDTKTAFTLISVKKEPKAATGAGLAKVALGNKTDTAFREMFKSDAVQDNKSKTLLIQCDYCGKYHCSSCWDLEKNRCKNCEDLSLRDVISS